jgi:outer membrane protein insertion porin family
MSLKPGSVYSTVEREQSETAIEDLYGKLGYLDTDVRIEPRFDENRPRVALDVRIEEGKPYTVGKVVVRGNNLTQTKVVLRELRGLTPGRRFDRPGLDRSRRRLNESPLFRDATITVLGEEDDETRDVLVEVTERNTGSITFGANVSSDLGLGGAIDITQRNFDITDFPNSASDLISGKAFRGAGQTFDLTLAPGARNSTYSVDWRDPHFLDSDYSFGVGLFLTSRDRNDYDEERFGGQVSLGRQFGDIWSAAINARYSQIEISDIAEDGSQDVFAVEGDNSLTSLGFSIVRSTADSFFAPSRGSRSTFGVDRAGALGGDFDFTRLNASVTKFWTVDEDFLDRKTVVSARVGVGYIVEENEAPVFERYYAGGRSFRGFDFRGIGPRGIRNDTGALGDESVGGRFSLLTTLQYEFPLVDNYLRGVIFTDQGTIDNDVTLEAWRVTAGVGVRMQVPFLSQAPFAVDFAIPLLEEDTDEAELVSFTLDIPFR